MSKIKDYLDRQGKCIEIPNVGRNDLPEFFKENGFSVGVEIGVYRGEYTELLAKSGMKIYGVDPWLAYDGYPYHGTDEEQPAHNKNYEETKKRLVPYTNVTLIRKTSMDALKDFEDESIDFCYIDGNHSFRYVADDMCEWIKKIKKGGFLCGHDYIYANPLSFHVRHVVDAYVQAHAIQSLWILGEKHAKKGETRDSWRSWLIRKV